MISKLSKSYYQDPGPTDPDSDDLFTMFPTREKKGSIGNLQDYDLFEGKPIEDPPFVLLAQQLMAMGFPKGQVKRLLCVHKVVSLSHGVELLTLDEKGKY
jgi:hypothetical protein